MDGAPRGGGGLCCTLEFAVQMTCQNCMETVQETLQKVPGLRIVDIQLDSQTVLVETSLGTEEVQNLLESTGRKAVLKGMGSSVPGLLGSAAVAMVTGRGLIQGVVRFLQVSPEKCLVDGTVDGLQPGLHGIHVHEFGDISRSFDSCGDHFNPNGECHGGPQDQHRHAGDLGNILVTADGRASFRMEDRQLKVDDIIGRSLVIDEGEDDLGHGSHPLSKVSGNSGERVACGIIARSAGLFQNPKKICSCSGVTLWEERKSGKAVPGRPTPHL
ncbi:copper chaperone for superoxide dismutase isoform X1 [Python bivittatus]|uniref:Superoxide dismutase copper chaperone n=2 Tax=Python bivittatus TaxID=176946 RepID=A0A9F2QZD6_PYTBI|nr:copper chaperone for superoxide dismutase isoform X1 [Python bivittatus]